MVDYSKWDSYAAELSDSDEDMGKPSVTKLENKSSVKIGPNGVSVIPSLTNKAVEKEKSYVPRTLNGGSTSKFDWQQTRNDVTLYVFLPHDARASDLTILLSESNLDVNLSNVNILSGKFRYPIIETVVDDIDWEIKDDALKSSIDSSPRILEIKFQKKSLIQDTTLWWSCVFVGDPEIDTTQIQGRDKGRNASNISAWDAAHQMFKERIAQRELIDISDGDDDDKEES